MKMWGLIGHYPEGSRKTASVTLKRVDTQVLVRGFVARVTATLSYENDTDQAVEVEYVMPVDEGAAIYKFEADVNGRKITAHCMVKKKAEEMYKKAVKSGYTAVLGREDDLLSDVFHMALGNLPAKSKAELHLSMVMELKVKTDGAVSFTLPTILNPRYCPANISPDQHTKSVAQLGSPIASVSETYEFSIKAQVNGGHSIARITSHSDNLDVNLSDDALSADVIQSSGFTHDHDWNMVIYYLNPYKTHVIRETGDKTASGLMKDDLIMVNMHPQVPEESYSNRNEVIFVVDCSGSMNGDKIQSARATLLLFLKSLPADCYFNVVCFGSSFNLLFPNGSVKYTEESLHKALELHKKLDANLGGTEILQPLKAMYSKEPLKGYARQIILLSDGQVSNVDEVKKLVSRHAQHTRVFAVGIGHGASTALITGLARAGRGRSEMVYQQDKLEVKVMGLIQSMLQENVQQVEVNIAVDPPGGIKLVPKVPPVIFGGQHLILYTRVPPSAEVKGINIRGVIGSKMFCANAEGTDIVRVHDEEKTLHRLAARAQINEWQDDDEEDVAEDMVALSLASSVLSRRTAFVGVDQDMTPLAPAETLASGYSQRRRLRGRMMMSIHRPAPPPPAMDFSSGPLEMMSSYCRAPPPPAMDFSSGPLEMSSHRPASPPVVVLSSRHERSSHRLQRSSHRPASPPAMMNVLSGEVQYHEDIGAEIYACDGAFRSSAEDEVPGPASGEEKDTVMNSVALQKFNGSWTLEDASKLTSFSCQQLREANVTENELAWATALVLALLEMKHTSEKSKWMLISTKGSKFIADCGVDAKIVIAAAKKVLSKE